MRQSTLADVVFCEDIDEDYGHLATHLIEQDEPVDSTSKWTGVFSRDMQEGLMVAVIPMGPDLIFDASVRKTMSGVVEGTGEVIFSPYTFKVVDMPKNLEDGKLPETELIQLGHTATQAKARFAKPAVEVNLDKSSPAFTIVTESDEVSIKLNRAYTGDLK